MVNGTNSIEFLIEEMIREQLALGVAIQTVYRGHYVCIRSLREFFVERGGEHMDINDDETIKRLYGFR